MDQLGTGTEVPDPGAWDVADVCFWMEGNLVKTVKSVTINVMYMSLLRALRKGVNL